MIKNNQIGLLMLGLALIGFSCVTSERSAQQRDWDLYEWVFKNMLLPQSAEGVPEYQFLMINGEDPPRAFMNRFRGSIFQILPDSHSDKTKTCITHRETGALGHVLTVELVRWIDGDTVEIYGGRLECQLGAYSQKYRLERRGEGWVATPIGPRYVA